MKLLDVIKKIESKFLLKDACAWDFVGWQVQATSKQLEIKQVLITLDVSAAVVEQAIKEDIKLIICHHPFIFANSLNAVGVSWTKKALYKKLIDHQINVYVIHTNFDQNLDGMNWLIAKDLKFNHIKYFDQDKLAVIGQYDKLPLTAIITNVKKYFDLKTVKVISNDLKSTINNVVLASGAGGSVIEIISDNHDIDLVITGEMKWHQELEARDKNINVIVVGHDMEEKFVKFISDFLMSDSLLNKTLTIKQHFVPKTNYI